LPIPRYQSDTLDRPGIHMDPICPER
jgi:hypothetical protein